jgi:hypothetical protein
LVDSRVETILSAKAKMTAPGRSIHKGFQNTETDSRADAPIFTRAEAKCQAGVSSGTCYMAPAPSSFLRNPADARVTPSADRSELLIPSPSCSTLATDAS